MRPRSRAATTPKHPLPCRIHQPQNVGLIECEYGGIELRDDAAEERGRFDSAHTLGLVHIGQRIDFKGEIAEGIIAPGAACAKRIVFFAQCGHNIGQRLQGANYLVHERGDGQQKHQDRDSKDAENGSRGVARHDEDAREQADGGKEKKDGKAAKLRLKGEPFGPGPGFFL